MAVNHDYANVMIGLKNRSNMETDFKNRSKAKINSKNRTKAEANFKNRPKADPDFKTRPNAETVFKNRTNAETVFKNRPNAETVFKNRPNAKTVFKNRPNAETVFKNRPNAERKFKNRSNAETDVDFKNNSENELEDVYENLDLESSPSKSADYTALQKYPTRVKCLKSFDITWCRIVIAILLLAVVQSFVIVLVILSILSKEISRTSLESHSTENIDIKECGTPPSIDHGLYIMTGNSTGTIALYACVEGYYMKGIPAVFCQADGAWSLVKFSCIIENESEIMNEKIRRLNLTLELYRKSQGKLHALENENEIINEKIRRLNLTLELYRKSQGKLHALGFQEFEFDKSTLYNKRYISDDKKTISNHKITENMKKGNGNTYIYKGVLGTRQFTKHDIIYFEVVIYYKILRTLRLEEIAFDLGFSRLHSRGIYFGKNIYISVSYKLRCVNSLNKMIVRIQSNKLQTHFDKTLSPLTENTTFVGTFGFYVNGPQKQITYFQRHENNLEKLYMLTNVDFENPLYPTFVIGEELYFNVSLNLKTRKFIKTIPKQLYDSV